MSPLAEYQKSILVYLFLAIVTLLVYGPGLSTGFQLDDLNNLGLLSTVSENGILSFVFSGLNFPSGRPLSLLSFALQHSAWQDNPFAFKAVNLAIHLLCGGLLFLICKKLARYIFSEQRNRILFSTLVAAFWLLHPVHLTTVLYVVQRMTQLSAFFVFLGVYSYLELRERYLLEQRQFYLYAMGFAVWFGILLAVLSKENGILLPLYLLVINYSFIDNKTPNNDLLTKINWIVLGLPIAAILVYLAAGFEQELSNYTHRPFTMAERLMTQAVILVEYIKNILFPLPAAFTLFHDDFPVSSGLLSPPKTLISHIVITILLFTAVIVRSRGPVITFSILWFFAGHLLESTYLNLELYFEHRNYAPSFGIFFLMGYVIVWLRNVKHGIWTSNIGACGLLILFLFTSVNQVNNMTAPIPGLIEQVNAHPDSVRAVTELGNLYLINGNISAAERLYGDIALQNPDAIYPQIKLMAIKTCIKNQSLTTGEWRLLFDKASVAKNSGYGVTEELLTISVSVNEDDCQTIEINNLIRLIVTLALNPEYHVERPALHELAARLGIKIGDRGVAYFNIQDAVKLSPTVSRKILKAQILLALDQIDEARDTISDLMSQLDNDFRLKLGFNNRVQQLRQELESRIQ